MAKMSLAEILQLDQKVAIVTGGAKGSGRGIAEQLVEAGADMILSDVAQDIGQAASSETGASHTGDGLGCRLGDQRYGLARAAPSCERGFLESGDGPNGNEAHPQSGDSTTT